MERSGEEQAPSMDHREINNEEAIALNASVLEALPSPPIFIVNSLCALGMALAFLVAKTVYSVDLITDPSLTLFIIWVIELPIVILLYSCYRKNPQQCTYLRSVGRGILGVPAGALLVSLLAIAYMAPVTSQPLSKTVNWSLMMSLFTTVPASCVLGSSWADWKRVFPLLKANGLVEELLCDQAHSVLIGAWIASWPMPYVWEKARQEWPISVTYGALAGYLVSFVVMMVLEFFDRRRFQHVKKD